MHSKSQKRRVDSVWKDKVVTRKTAQRKGTNKMKKLVMIFALLVSARASTMAQISSAQATYDSSAVWTTLIIGGLIVSIIIWLATRSRQANPSQLAAEADQFFANMRAQLVGHAKLPTCDSPVILEFGEAALLSEPSSLLEGRATRYYAGLGTRVGGIYVGGGQSQNVESLKTIDSGTLTLTTKRLVFTGSLETRVVKLADLVSVEQYADAIEIATSRRMKRQVQTVHNPIIWSRLIAFLLEQGFPTKAPEEVNLLVGGIDQYIPSSPSQAEHGAAALLQVDAALGGNGLTQFTKLRTTVQP
jgi:hypothetical protein